MNGETIRAMAARGILPTRYPRSTRRKRALMPWIRENRAEIDAAIRGAIPNCGSLNDNDRRLHVINDEGMYAWAKSEGVDV